MNKGSIIFVVRRTLLIVLLLLLIGYVGWLLVSQYRSHTALRSYYEGQLLSDVDRRATAAGYFISERVDDMKRLANLRELEIYFTNQNLGMSLEYGLGASMLDAWYALGEIGYFKRIVFVEKDSGILLDTREGGPLVAASPGKNWDIFKDSLAEEPTFHLDTLGSKMSFVLAMPFKSDGIYRGQLLGYLDVNEFYDRFFASSDSSSGVIGTSLLFYDSVLVASGNGRSNMNDHIDTLSGLPIKLITALSKAALSKSESPVKLLILTGTIGIIILFGAWWLIRAMLKNAELDAKLRETSVREETVAAMNQGLESKVKERTADLEKAYAELKSAQIRLLQQEKMASIGQLAAGVAHEINNPIGFMLSNLNTLKDYSESITNFVNYATKLSNASNEWSKEAYFANEQLLNEKRKELFIDNALDDIKPLIQETMEGGERVRNIIQNLRGFARIDETGSKPIDINESLESTLTIAWNELKYKTKIIEEYGAIPKILGNGGEINQVFLNLIINAHQAIKEQGTITIKTWHDDKSIYISIADNGCGIPSEVKNKIFEPFFTTKEVGAGTGLGLSISYDIIKNHGGSIDVWSEKDVGSRFTITLPLME